MITSTAQNMRCTVISEMANLRSSGLFDGFLSMYGAKIRTISPTPGIVTPAIIGWNIVSSSCRPRKYHGAFDGFGVWLVLASCSSGALTKIEKTNVNARQASDGDELGGQQVRPRVHLVDRGRLDLLDRAALDDREQALRVTAGSGADGHGPALAGAATTAPDPLGDGDAAPTARRLGGGAARLRALAARLRSSRWAGIRGIGGRLLGGGGRVGRRGRLGRRGVGGGLVAGGLGPLQEVLGDLSH